jgi:branched-chain amino acid transport system permease protein
MTSMLVAFALFGTLPLWIERVGLYRYLGVEILIWCVFALGFNLLLGYTGLPSFGHGAYFGIGAYALGLTQFHLVANLWVGLLAAIVAASLVGGGVALFISHRRGIYFALMTIAFGQMFFFVASKWTSVTGGEDGLLNIRRLPAQFGPVAADLTGNLAFSYFAFAVFVVVTLFMWRLVHSPLGKVLRAIKQNETRMAYLGYRVFVYKWLSFTLSCAVGGLFAMAQGGAYVQVMSIQWSGVVVLMALIGGGLVSFWGPVIGTVVYFVARDLLGAYTESWLLWFGLMFMGVVMFKPEGVAGVWQDVAARVGARRRARAGALQPAAGD